MSLCLCLLANIEHEKQQQARPTWLLLLGCISERSRFKLAGFAAIDNENGKEEKIIHEMSDEL